MPFINDVYDKKAFCTNLSKYFGAADLSIEHFLDNGAKGPNTFKIPEAKSADMLLIEENCSYVNCANSATCVLWFGGYFSKMRYYDKVSGKSSIEDLRCLQLRTYDVYACEYYIMML